MKELIIFALILITLLSGCTAQVVKTEELESTKTTETPTIPEPQVISSQQPSQEAKITTGTEVEITEAPPEENTPSQPTTYHVNIVQGIGIREGSG